MIRPQAGFQERFLSSPAQIVIGGGSAGAGKTYALLMEAIRYSDKAKYGGVVFRRTTPQIRNQGGLWDTSQELFAKLPHPPKGSEMALVWKFQKGGRLKFSHLQHEKDKYNWQGSQIPFIAFDELTHFSESQFFYLLSRNRSPFGIPAYVRATCNPDSSSWVKKFIDWWLYPDDFHIQVLQGMPRPDRDGKVRYFMRDGNHYIWGNSPQEVIKKAPHIFEDRHFLQSLLDSKTSPESLVKSVTFLFGDVYGNKKLLGNDPQYLANLISQDTVEKNRLLKGSWKMVSDEYKMYDSDAILDLFSNDYIRGGKKYITADIAMEGSDQFIICVWDGWRLIDVTAIDKSDGAMILSKIKEKAKIHKVPTSRICYDSDGVGSFLKGFLKGAKAFKNGSKPIGKKDINYENLKTQCYYLLADFINDRKMFVGPTPFRDQIIQELEAIKKIPYDGVGRLRMIRKSELKMVLGRSPDFADAIMMRVMFELKKRGSKVTSF